MNLQVLRVPALIMFLAAFCVLSGCSRTGLQPLKSELKNYGYTLYEPPRSNRGPGWTFRMVKTFDGNTVPMTVCENLYSDPKTVDGKLSIPSITKSTTVGLDVALDFLQGLVPDLANAKANLKDVRSVTITWMDVADKELPEEFKLIDTDKPRPINATCANVLRELKRRGELQGNVFLVQQAVSANKMRYEFNADRSAGANLAGKYQDLIGFKAGANVTTKSQTILEISEPRFVGFAGVLLIDWLPSGQLAAEQMATIRVRRISTDELERIIGR